MTRNRPVEADEIFELESFGERSGAHASIYAGPFSGKRTKSATQDGWIFGRKPKMSVYLSYLLKMH